MPSSQRRRQSSTNADSTVEPHPSSAARSFRLPPELAAQFLRSSSGNRGSAKEPDINEIMGMFAEIMTISGRDGEVSGSFSRVSTEKGSMVGEVTFQFYDKNDSDDEEEDETQNDTALVKELTEEEMAELEEGMSQERSKNSEADKRRGKKLRKREKLQQEAMERTQEVAQRKVHKQLQSWKSRVIQQASQNDAETFKMRCLLQESPLNKCLSPEEHLESLLSYAIDAESSTLHEKEASPRNLLASYIVDNSLAVVLTPSSKNGRTALHTACLEKDVYFVNLVLERAKQENVSCLELYCQDSGWTPLHCAVAAGSSVIVELLLAAGASVATRTDESQTYRTSDQQGLTARELAECIVAGSCNDVIETYGDALQEVMQRNPSNQGYLNILRKLMERLKDVETNGYSALKSTADVTPLKTTRASGIGEDSHKRRTKKKKKKQPKKEKTDMSAPSVVGEPLVERKEDPLVVALSGMGFTHDQIYAAAKGCGGLERATADDMVMWILSGGETTPVESPAQETVSGNPSEVESAATTGDAEEPKPSAADLKRAQEANIEVVKREQEARVAAERLAAKKEEQRRRNREWNNREQARQREELQRRALEEAQRVALEKVKAQEREKSQKVIVPGAVPTMVGRTVEVSAKPNKQAAPRMPTKILQRPSQSTLITAPSFTHSHEDEAGAPPSGVVVPSMFGRMPNAGDLILQEDFAPRPASVPLPGFYNGGGVVSSTTNAGSPGEIRATAKAFVPTSFNPTPPGQPLMIAVTSAPAALLSSEFLAPAPDFRSSRLGNLPSMDESSALSGDMDPLPSLLSCTASAGTGVPLGFLRPPTVMPSASDSPSPSATSSSVTTGISAIEEPILNSVIGFHLDASAPRSSTVDPLNPSSSHVAASSSIWGSSSLAQMTDFPGFGPSEGTSSLHEQESHKGVGAVGSGTNGWNAATFSRGGTSNGFGSIW